MNRHMKGCCPRSPLETTPDRLTEDLSAVGRRVLILYGASLPAGLRAQLHGEGRGFRTFEMSGAEPSPLDESVQIGASICRQEKIEILLAVGGPAVLDFAARVGDCFRKRDPSGYGVNIVHLPVQDEKRHQ